MAIINGNDASNQLNGTNLADQIFGRGGNDALEGLDGNDLLEGGAGIDDQYGGNGFDYASYRSSGAGVGVLLDLGYGLGGDAEGDGLYDIEGVIGSGYARLPVRQGRSQRAPRRGRQRHAARLWAATTSSRAAPAPTSWYGDAGFDYASYKSSPAGVVR